MSLWGEIGFGIKNSCLGLVFPQTTYNQHTSCTIFKGGMLRCKCNNTQWILAMNYLILFEFIGTNLTSSISIDARLMYPLHEICIASSKVKINTYHATSKLLKSSTSCTEYLFENSSSSTFLTALQMNTGWYGRGWKESLQKDGGTAPAQWNFHLKKSIHCSI